MYLKFDNYFDIFQFFKSDISVQFFRYSISCLNKFWKKKSHIHFIQFIFKPLKKTASTSLIDIGIKKQISIWLTCGQHTHEHKKRIFTRG